MNYEVLRKISDYFYIDFIDITNAISEQSENIYDRFRVATEELLAQINNSHNYVVSGEKFYNRIINNKDFKLDMIKKYKCDPKLMNCLNKIQELGNKVVHNQLKVFDEKDVKDTFFRILILAKKVLQFERNDNSFNFNVHQVNAEVERLMNLKEKNVSNFDKEDFVKNIYQLDESLTLLFPKLEEEEFKNNFIIEFKNLVSVILNYIITFNVKYSTLEDLKIGEYSELYKIYCNIDFLNQVDFDTIIAYINDYSYIIRNIVSRMFNINILNLNFKTNKDLIENNDFESIAKAIDEVTNNEDINFDINNVVYYIESQKLIINNGNSYYIVDLRKAINDNATCNTVYSKYKLPDNYATEISLKAVDINLIGISSKEFVITDYKIAIRPCEIKKLIFVITGKELQNNISKNSKFYTVLMNFLQNNKCTLLDILTSNDNTYNNFILDFNKITSNDCLLFIEAMNKARRIILEDEWESGANLLRYFTSYLNNTVLKDNTVSKEQLNKENFKGLYFKRGSYRFDRNPFSFSLCGHNLNSTNLYKCFSYDDYKVDIFAKKLFDEMNDKDTLFIDLNDKSIESKDLIEKYNEWIDRNDFDDAGKLNIIDNYVYRCDYVSEINSILDKLILDSNREKGNYYSDLSKKYLKNNKLDSKKKFDIINNAFNNSSVAMILGEAGSGKTELLCNYFTNIFEGLDIIYISNTHTCKYNMKRRIIERGKLFDNYVFKTAYSIANDKYFKGNFFDVVIIDECKSIANKHIEKILNKISYTYCILAGDIGQIDAIRLGNWFEVASQMINKNSVFLLEENYRTDSNVLKDIWKRVRNKEEDTLKYLIDNNYIEMIGPDIFKQNSDDEIRLCLNKHGTYGIKKINRYFQNKNPNPAFENGIDIYKVDDPIVFNENANEKRYGEYLYNNLKGKIREIKEDEDYLYFCIHIQKYIPSYEDFVISSNEQDNWSNIEIKVRKYTDKPDDDDEDNYKVPFEVTYALSIHKAQGLEYDSVKIIITPESEEIINNKIFYTAITRAKKKLKIYLTKKDQENILDILSEKIDNKDVILLEKMRNNIF